MRILVVEDEKRLAAALKRGLGDEGFAVDVAFDGTESLWMAQEGAYDAIVLDIMLPGVNGYKVCAQLREAGNWTPILMLTAKDGEFDHAEALDTGADDFLTKPFSYVVLVAHLRARSVSRPREQDARLPCRGNRNTGRANAGRVARRVRRRRLNADAQESCIQAVMHEQRCDPSYKGAEHGASPPSWDLEPAPSPAAWGRTTP
ncbi:MAG: response regulator [Actinomycetota bacterium]|nr:response regulator [Actinomycetota bacterium]